jgi:checkpoint serine/threonine-protein kinase
VSCHEPFPYWFVLYLTLEMLYMLSYLHKCKILHADIKVDNILINKLPESSHFFDPARSKCLVLIDFNRSIDMNVLPEESEFAFKISNTFLRCCEMQNDRAWSYQIDYYGILSSIYCVIFKKYMSTANVATRNRITTAFPRQYDKIFARMFDSFLNIPSSRELPDLDGDFIANLKVLFEQELNVSFRKSAKYLAELNENYPSSLRNKTLNTN